MKKSMVANEIDCELLTVLVKRSRSIVQNEIDEWLYYYTQQTLIRVVNNETQINMFETLRYKTYNKFNSKKNIEG